jgi:hypothetical protein
MNLRYCLMTAVMTCNEYRHPQDVMRELSIDYQHPTPQSMYDQWWFWNCKGKLDNLPDYLSELHLKPRDCVGLGLNQEMADEIERAAE